jgi:uncharacterized integral membrane protein
MRWVYLAVIILFALAVIIFAVQNLDTVTVTFLSFNAGIRLAVLVAIVYVLGAATGGSLYGLLRKSYQGATRSMKVTP